MKKHGEKISMLTSYDYSMAKTVDAGGVDAVLVGDVNICSLGNQSFGHLRGIMKNGPMQGCHSVVLLRVDIGFIFQKSSRKGKIPALDGRDHPRTGRRFGGD